LLIRRESNSGVCWYLVGTVMPDLVLSVDI
jgi:hypothetical protein